MMWAKQAFIALAKGTGLIAGGILTAAVVIGTSEYSQTHWTPPKNTLPIVLCTSIAFAAVIFQFRRMWMRVGFWVMLSLLLAIHVAGCLVVLRLIPEFKVAWFGLLIIPEVPILCSWIDRTVGGVRRPREDCQPRSRI